MLNLGLEGIYSSGPANEVKCSRVNYICMHITTRFSAGYKVHKFFYISLLIFIKIQLKFNGLVVRLWLLAPQIFVLNYISDSFSIELSSRQTNTHTQTRRHINSGGIKRNHPAGKGKYPLNKL